MSLCTDRRFKFEERRQLFIRSHDEPLPVAAMRVSNPDRSALPINGRNAAPTPTGFAEIVNDGLPAILQYVRSAPGYVDALAGDVPNGRIVTVSLNVIT